MAILVGLLILQIILTCHMAMILQWSYYHLCHMGKKLGEVREGVRRRRGGEEREREGRMVAQEAKGGRQTGVGIVSAPLWLVGHNRSH